MAITFLLDSPHNLKRATAALERTALDGKQEVVIRRKTRTTKQEKRLRAMLKAIMDAGATFAGRTWDSSNWRRTFISAYLTQKGQETGTVVEGLEGELLILGDRRGSDLNVDEWGELMMYVQAWIDQRGITWVEKPDPTLEHYEAYSR